MLAKFIVVFLALSTFANAAPAMRRGVSVTVDGHTIHLRDLDAAPAMRRGHEVSVHVNGHIHLRDPAVPPPANSHESESKLLASDIAKDLQRVHSSTQKGTLPGHVARGPPHSPFITNGGDPAAKDSSKANNTKGNSSEANNSKGDSSKGNTPKGDSSKGNTPKGSNPKGDSPKNDSSKANNSKGGSSKGAKSSG